MAENTIDNLSIQVTASAENAARMFDRLASSAGRLRGASRSAAGGMRDMASAADDMGTETREAETQIERTTRSVRRFWEALGRVGNQIRGGFVRAIHAGTSAIGTFLRSIARIAFYRAIRSMIKDLGQSFRDLYGYSRLFGTDFSKSMDRITTASVYLRNSLAAMVAPLVNMFAPALDLIADKIVDILNFVNQLFAAINGQATYTVAKKVATTWESTFDSAANHAKKRIREVRNTLLGFDEINRLNGATPTSTGSTGSSPYTPGYSTMFQEKPLEGFFKKLSDVTSGMPDWLKWLLTGTALVGGFLLIKKFIPWLLKKLGELFVLKIPDWLRWLFGPRNNNNVGIDIPDKIDIPDGKIKVNIDPDSLKSLDKIKDIPINLKPENSVKELYNKLLSQWMSLQSRTLFLVAKFDNTAKVLFGVFKNTWDELPSHTLYMTPKFDNTAVVLFNSFKKAWDEAGTKILYFSAKLDNRAKVLFDAFKRDWDTSGSKTLYFAPKLNNKAKVLFDEFKNDWNSIGSLSLYMTPKLDQSAVSLFRAFAKAWSMIPELELKIGLKFNVVAAALLAEFKADWNTLVSTLYFTPKFDNTASVLYDQFKKDWYSIASLVLYMSPKLDNTAKTLFDKFRKEWNKIASRTLYMSPKLDNTAQVLFDEFRAEWNRIFSLALYMTPKLDNTASVLFNAFRADWNNIVGKIVYVSPKLDNIPSVLFNEFKGAWNRLESRTVYLSPKLDNAASVVFGAFKREWDLLRATVSIAINTQSAEEVFARFNRDWNRGGQPPRCSVLVELIQPWGNWFGGVLKYLGLDRLTADVLIGLRTTWGNPFGDVIAVLGLRNLSADVYVGLEKDWWGDPLKWLGLTNLKTAVSVGLEVTNDVIRLVGQNDVWWLEKNGGSNKTNLGGASGGGGSSSGGGAGRAKKWLGGVFSGGVWSNLPQYAGGTYNAHGSLFLAGERGPEIVGHVGGRTEVLNKSQLASAMYSAVTAAMAPAAANFANAASAMSAGNADDSSMNALLDMVRLGGEALVRQNSLLAQQNEYLRQINDKEFSADITTASINRANDRNNRRAGTTVAPVY